MEERGIGTVWHRLRIAPRRAGPIARIIALAVLAGPAVLQGQSLDQYDYENLRLRGGGAELFVVYPNNVKSTIGVGGRIDLGFLGPKVRTMIRGAYWSSELKESETARFEGRLEELVEEQNPGSSVSIDLGKIDRSALIFGLDLQWMPLPAERVRPYIGIGAEVYFLNGSGAAIDGTFVEEALDLLTAGVSGVGGLEVEIGGGFAVYGDVRGALAADVRSLALTAGLAYITP